jgi:hypothetical protein
MAKVVTHRPGRQHSLYVLSERIYSGKRCFYCGKLLRGSRTREHVFPLWLQKRFNLSDQHLTLLNGTLIPYRQLTVPCCPTCNNVHLSKLETRVQRLLFESPIAVARRDLKDIYIWANKILLGIVYAERLLPLNRRNPKGRTILPRKMRDMFNMTHFLIQSLRFPIRFTAEGEERIPGSAFLFDLKSPRDTKLQFDFKDNLFTLGVSLRIGNRGIVTLSDGGAIDLSIGDLLRRDGKRKLHPIQFNELTANAFYKATLLNRTPKYIMFESNNAVEVMQMPLMGLSSKSVFDDWDQKAYAHMLSFLTGHPVGRLKPDDTNRVMTFISDAEGNPVNIPLGRSAKQSPASADERYASNRRAATPMKKATTTMKKSTSKEEKGEAPPSHLIDARIKELGGWRGEALARIRALIKQADPEVVEEWKWGIPVWSHGGIICTGETYKAAVKTTFAKGAALEDPSSLFNSSLEGNVRRAIDFHEGGKIDEKAFKALIRAAVALNTSKPAKAGPVRARKKPKSA